VRPATKKGGSGERRSRLAVLTALGQLTLAGCYAYTAVEPVAAPAGSDVRIHVDRGAALSVGTLPLVENGEGIMVRGTLLASPATDTLLCSVALRPEDPGAASMGLRGTVSIPLGMVREMEVRHMDRTRTFGLAGAGAVLAWIIVDAAFDIRNPEQGPEGSDNTDNAVVTLFRVRW
jgi:hypothetical protein